MTHIAYFDFRVISKSLREAISAIRNTVIHDAENLGLEPIYEAKCGKVSTIDQELDICDKL